MKKLLIIGLVLLSFMGVNAQNDKGKLDDLGRITLAAYVPQQIDKMPDAARSMLSNKLNQIVTASGMGGSAFNQRFIITANITLLTKDITATAPPMHAYTLEITLYVGDGIEGTKFASHSVTVKGVGENENKAYIAALKTLKTNDPSYQTFLTTGKNKIIEYYNTKCDFILKDAQTLATQNQYEEAIFKLTSVPDVCKACYDKAMAAVGPIYKKQIDRACKVKLAEANNIWAANQSIDAANEAGAILSAIDPDAACFAEVKALSNKIATRVKEIDAREWQYIVKDQQQESERIKAMRDIGVAYGNGQPKNVTYNVVGWW